MNSLPPRIAQAGALVRSSVLLALTTVCLLGQTILGHAAAATPLEQALLAYDKAVAADATSKVLAKLTSPVLLKGTGGSPFNFGETAGDTTIEFILEGDSTAGADSYLAVGKNNSSSLRYAQWPNTRQLGFTLLPGVADYLFTPRVPSPTNATHLAYVWDAKALSMKVYVNGVALGSTSQVSTDFAMPNGEGFLGANPNGTEAMVGTIYRVTVYGGVLSEATIQKHATAFSNVLPQTIPQLRTYDAVIAADTASGLVPLANLTTPVTLNGSGGFAFKFGNTKGDTTMEFIVEGDPTNGDTGYLAVGENTTNNLRFAQWRGTHQMGFTRLGVADYVFSPPLPSPTVLTHVVYVWNSTALSMTLYTNGVLAGTAKGINPGFTMPSGAGFLGGNPTGGEPMVGTIARVVVYPGMVSQATIERHASAFSDYAFLPRTLKVTPDTGRPGFVWRISQVAPEQINSNQRAEQQLSGQLKNSDGNPLPNLANPNAPGAADGPAQPAPGGQPWQPIEFVVSKNPINFSQTEGEKNGNFTPDLQMPGVPGIEGGDDNIAAELIAYIELPAGLTWMGINSDDGFKATAGTGGSSIVVGEYDGGRSAADSIFGIFAEEAGVYPFRVVWEEGQGAANIEWFTLKADESKVLVNDVSSGGLKAYRALASNTQPARILAVGCDPYGNVDLFLERAPSLQSAQNLTNYTLTATPPSAIVRVLVSGLAVKLVLRPPLATNSVATLSVRGITTTNGVPFNTLQNIGVTNYPILPSGFISIARVGSSAVLTWSPTNAALLKATSVQGPWTMVPKATSPYTISLNPLLTKESVGKQQTGDGMNGFGSGGAYVSPTSYSADDGGHCYYVYYQESGGLFYTPAHLTRPTPTDINSMENHSPDTDAVGWQDPLLQHAHPPTDSIYSYCIPAWSATVRGQCQVLQALTPDVTIVYCFPNDVCIHAAAPPPRLYWIYDRACSPP